MKKVNLKPAKEKSLLRKHPWVFSGAIKNVEKDTKDGSIVEIFSNQENYLATGHYNEGNISVRIFEFDRQEINEEYWKKKIKKAKAVEETRLLKYTVKGFLLNIINVSCLVIWAGVIVWFGPKVEMSPVKIWTFFIVSVITYLAINVLKFFLSSRLKSKLTDKVLFYIRQGLNILILIFGIVLVFKGL